MAKLSAREVQSALSRAMFRVMIPSYLRAGFSANAMILDARKYMPMYQRSLMLQDIRRFQGLFVGQSSQAKLDRTKEIPLSKMPSVDYGNRPAFRVYGEAHFVNPMTGEDRPVTVSFFTDRHYGIEAYEDYMNDQVDMEDYIPGWTIGGVDFIVAERNAQSIS